MQGEGVRAFYPGNNGREGLLIWLIAGTNAALDPSALSLRLPSAIVGSLTVIVLPATFLALMRFFRVHRDDDPAFNVVFAAGAAMFFLATSFWHLNASRIAFRAILDPFFSALAVLLICLALTRSRKAAFGCMAGAVAGLGLYGYGTFKFMAIPILFLLAYAILERRPRVLRQVSLMTASALAVSLPLLHFVITNPAVYFHRLSEISVAEASAPLKAFVHSVLVTLQMFFAEGDRNPRHNLDAEPQVNLILLICLAVGAAFLLHRSGRHRAPNGPGSHRALGLFLLVYWVSMLLPASIVYEPWGQPHALRAIGLVVPTMILAGIGAGVGAALLHRVGLRPGVLYLSACLIAGAVAVGVTVDYHYRFPRQPETAEAFNLRTTESARKLVESPTPRKQLIFTGSQSEDAEHWAVSQFLFLSGNDLASHNACIAAIDDVVVREGLEGARIFVPAALEGALSPTLKERNEILLY